MIIGISGPPGAGKTTAGKYLSSTYRLIYLRYSEVLADMLGETEPDKDMLRNFGWDVMSEDRQKSLNQKLLTRMEIGISYVVDGLRHPVDLETLSTNPNQPFYLLYIDASPEVRWQRLSSRDGFRTWEKFQAAENHPTEGYLPLLKEKAYLIFKNEMTIPQLYAELDRVFKKTIKAGVATNV